MTIIERLKNTSTGFLVQVGKNNMEVRRFEASLQSKGIVCRGYSFRNDGARFCEYSSACMVHLRPDHESVVFAKTRET